VVERGARVAAAALGLLLAACTTTIDRADRAWQAGDITTATAGYERVLTEGGLDGERERALVRLATLAAAPGSPTADPARARALLGELIARHPASELRREAEVLLALLDRADAVAARLAAAEQERGRVAAELERLKVDLSVKETTIARLRANLTEANAEVDRLRRALEQLKRIDLERRP